MATINRTALHGARIYGYWLLAIYDLLIMKILSPYVWRCHDRHYLDLYRNYMSSNHADIGVGTGYCLDRCEYQSGQVRLGLFDLQKNCLKYTARRLKRYQPECYQVNALEPICIDQQGFDSIGLGGILHCIPGDMADKGKVFDALQAISNPQSKIFGYTILNRGVRKTALSRLVYFILQQLKVINGLEDSPEQLRAELQSRFSHSEVTVIGCIAIFVAE